MSVATLRAPASRYSRKDAARILRVPVQQIVAWQRAGLLPQNEVFNIRELVRVRKLQDLRGRRTPARAIRDSVEAMRHSLGVAEPLEGSAQRVGTRLTFRYAGALLDPLTQQLAFDFEGAATLPGLPTLMHTGRDRQASQALLTAQNLFQQAVLLEEQKDKQAMAADLYREVLALWPAHAPAAVNLGTLLYNGKRYAEAEQQYRLAAEIDPDYALAFFDLGNVLDELQRLPEAIDAYQRAIQLVPRYADAHYNLALAYERLGEQRRALRHWTMYVRLDPTGPWAAHARARARKTLSSERLSVVARNGRLAS